MNREVGFVVVVFVHAWAVLLHAQATTASFVGTVTGSSSAALPGVSLVIQNQDTGISRTVVSDEAGRYSAHGLSVGTYQITASVPGFQTKVTSALTITRG